MEGQTREAGRSTNDAETKEAGEANEADLKGLKEGKKFVCWQH